MTNRRSPGVALLAHELPSTVGTLEARPGNADQVVMVQDAKQRGLGKHGCDAVRAQVRLPHVGDHPSRPIRYEEEV
jgi:hypothetical protein